MFWTISIALLIAWLLINKTARKWIVILYKTLPRDLKAARLFGMVNFKLYRYANTDQTVAKLFLEQVNQHPNKVAFQFEDQIWTFQQVEDFSNKVANYLKQEGYKHGDTIALLMENRPEYIGLWLGFSKLGGITALINTNLVSSPLLHCISVAQCKGIIYGSNFQNAISDIQDKLPEVKLYRFDTTEIINTTSNTVDLKSELETASTASPLDSILQSKTSDKAIYIYTSGTTGLPKAANITHARYIFATVGAYYAAELNSDDIFYNPLPQYHSSGGMVGTGQTLLLGITNVLRMKFSASNFWVDCKKYNCTVTNYIGELCRYLLAAHKKNSVVDHRVKKMIGNGLRGDIWKTFQETFKISQIYELYGSTEGNANIVNIDNTIGAVGFIPPYANFLYPIRLLKFDEVTKKPIRNQDGMCIQCKPGEPGVLVGIIKKKNAINQFTGYVDAKETKKKIIEDVYRKGDLYFNTGDIMIQDELGYFYFKDRTGDTFRWKGENVATNEVECTITDIIGPKEIIVYGVEVPHTDGKAGMVTILDPERTINIEELGRRIKEHLPSYAIPYFLRLTDSLPMTGTLKVKKMDLQKDGFDPEKVKDPLYFYEARSASYIPLSNIYQDLISGKIRI